MTLAMDWVRRISWKRHVICLGLLVAGVGTAYLGGVGSLSRPLQSALADEILVRLGVVWLAIGFVGLAGWLYGMRLAVIWEAESAPAPATEVQALASAEQLAATCAAVESVASGQKALQGIVKDVLESVKEFGAVSIRIEALLAERAVDRDLPVPPAPQAPAEQVERFAQEQSEPVRRAPSTTMNVRHALRCLASSDSVEGLTPLYASMHSGGSSTGLLDLEHFYLSENDHNQGTFVLFEEAPGAASVFPNPVIWFRSEVSQIFPHLTDATYRNTDDLEPRRATKVSNGMWKVRRPAPGEGVALVRRS